MLKKIDSFGKGWKTFTTSGIFIALTAWVATQGYDIVPLVDSLEQAYIGLSGVYAAVVTLLRAADKAGRDS